MRPVARVAYQSAWSSCRQLPGPPMEREDGTVGADEPDRLPRSDGG